MALEQKGSSTRLEKSDQITKRYPKAWYCRIKGKHKQNFSDPPPQKAGSNEQQPLPKIVETKEVIKRGHRWETKVE